MGDAFGALRETISCVIAVSLSGVLAACVQATGSGTVIATGSCRMLSRATSTARLMGQHILAHGPRLRRCRLWELIALLRCDIQRFMVSSSMLKRVTTLAMPVVLLLLYVMALIRMLWIGCRQLLQLSWHCFAPRYNTL